MNMADISRETYEGNGIETINSNGILWLNQWHIGGLDQTNLWMTTRKYLSDHRKQGTGFSYKKN